MAFVVIHGPSRPMCMITSIIQINGTYGNTQPHPNRMCSNHRIAPGSPTNKFLPVHQVNHFACFLKH
uniref:Uncharacterized protein n=1 Tax=Rhizophora mucronata TaxID=61149 RepID=A0A2P2JUV1_RHIMU